LPVSAWLSPDNRARRPRYPVPVAIPMLAIALHITLLKIGGETVHVLIVRKYGFRLNAEEINVPQAYERHQHGNILFKCSFPKMPVHFIRTLQQALKIIEAKGQCNGKTN